MDSQTRVLFRHFNERKICQNAKGRKIFPFKSEIENRNINWRIKLHFITDKKHQNLSRQFSLHASYQRGILCILSYADTLFCTTDFSNLSVIRYFLSSLEDCKLYARNFVFFEISHQFSDKKYSRLLNEISFQ